ncbi:MAG: substrate-binding domain-containing protein, partial [Pseudomonadota bacterium]
GFREIAGDNCVVHFASDYAFDAGRSAMEELIAQNRLAKAFFCGDDVIAIGASSALRANGRTVPGDVGLIGVNGMEISGWDNVDLTTFRQPVDQIASAVIERLRERMENPSSAHKAIRFEPTLIERGSLRRVRN